jgi:hypothetical protein
MPKRFTREQIIAKFVKVHGDRYDYSLVDYKGCGQYITIVCKEHGPFPQMPESHYSGHGCRACYEERANWIDADNFIQKAKSVHGDKYDYALVKFVDIYTEVVVICRDHGPFNQKPKYHINNQSGCLHCRDPVVIDRVALFDRFVKAARKIHGLKYEYDLDVFVNMSTKTLITCKKHGKWPTTPTLHVSKKQGCKRCADEAQSHSTEWFIKEAKKIHGDRYDYSLVEYTTKTKYVSIICRVHKAFPQTPHCHLLGHGCRRCKHFVSKPETEWLDELGIPNEYRQKTLSVDSRRCRVDAYDPTTNTVYEFYGDYWHGNPKLYKKSALNKSVDKTYGQLYKDTMKREKLLKKAGYKVISIWEHDWKESKAA